MKKLLLFLAILGSASFAQAQVYEIIILNGKIIDGSGNPWYYGDVAIANGKIAAIGKLSNASAKKVIDAKGLVVTPGFVDVHTHIEDDELELPTGR